MTVSWPHNVFKQDQQKCDKTQFLINKLTSLSSQLEVGIMVLNLSYTTLMSARPHYRTRSNWSRFVQGHPDESCCSWYFHLNLIL